MATLSRAEYVPFVCNLVGGNNIARVIDARDGWPGLIEVFVGGAFRRFSLHVGPIHPMARGKSYEYRFQNPGQDRPVMVLPNSEPLLIGVWDSGPPYALVAADPNIRIGDSTRFSVLFPERLFRGAQEFGWSEPFRNNKGGLHWAFLPQLLPTFIEFYSSGIGLRAGDIQIAIAAAGLVDQPQEVNAAARARAAATRLVRDAKFGKVVVTAYDYRCAMCGLNMGLVSGAHIHPVSAPGSSDQPTNGLALCENHHRAFDTHRIWVDPTSRDVKIHPKMIESAKQDARDKIFIDTTFQAIIVPTNIRDHPDKKMFDERYEYFDGFYDWI